MSLFKLIKTKIRFLAVKRQVKDVYFKSGIVKAYSRYKELTKVDLITCIKTVKPWLIQWGYKGE